MRRKFRGGIEGIVAIIILAGLVVALIVAVILPSARQTAVIGEGGEEKLGELAGKLGVELEEE